MNRGPGWTKRRPRSSRPDAGRHPAEVVGRAEGDDAHERECLVAAFGKVASEHGYRDLTIELVARCAGSSQERVVRHFASKEEGLAAAHEAFLSRIRLDVREACQGTAEWPAKVRLALRAVLVTLVEAGNLGRAFTVEASSASLAAAQRQSAALEQFAELLREGRHLYPRAASLPDPTEHVLIGGVASVLFQHLLYEDPAALPALEPELVATLLTPYLGEGEAWRAAAGPLGRG